MTRDPAKGVGATAANGVTVSIKLHRIARDTWASYPSDWSLRGSGIRARLSRAPNEGKWHWHIGGTVDVADTLDEALEQMDHACEYAAERCDG